MVEWKAMFSTTPLRSYLKRVKQKDGVKKRKECFKISKRIKTKNIVRKLVDSTETHHWDDSFIGKELSEYLEAAVLRLKKASESKVTEEPSAVVIGQNEEPSTSQVKVMDAEVMWPPQSEPQPSTSQVKVVDTEVIRQQKEPQPSASQVKDDEKRKDNGQRVKLSQDRINQ